MKACKFIFLLFSFSVFAQNEEYKAHLKSIYHSCVPINMNDKCAHVKDSFFVDHVIRNNLEKPEHIKFITNRNLLKKINVLSCYSEHVWMKDTIEGIVYEVTIKANDFDSTGKIIKNYEKEDLKNYTEKINDQIPFGSSYGLPKKEFNSIEISVNGKQLYIPHSAYTNLYNPFTCEYDSMMKSISLYSSLDKRFIYMYIFGGNAADTYMAKLIFDHEKYITRIIVEYVDLSCYGSFRKSFIGF